MQSALKTQDFQVCIKIIEARQLVGANIDPIICVQIDDQKKYTSVRQSTNNPYYDEYFVFDFHMPALVLFDKIITLSVFQSRKFHKRKLIGSFKLDITTVWSQPDHQFYRKWALLIDPDDTAAGPKGYLKCDISVIGKGDSLKEPPKSEKDEDDIEANLLMPDGVPIERQRAQFIVSIYRADGLPKKNVAKIANITRKSDEELADSYVQVSFAGLTGKTSIIKGSYTPAWNEQLVFTEMFPFLCQRIKIQLRYEHKKSNVIGTHFIDLRTISNDGEKGFLPTFGPTFIHFYGSTRDYYSANELNEGLDEGVAYRARLLIAMRTEITDMIDTGPSEVKLESTEPLAETRYIENDEFLLFATVLDASMIDNKLAHKPISFELSIGNAGIVGQNQSINLVRDPGNNKLDNEPWQNTTPPTKPMTHDHTYHFLPYLDNKPCMHVRSIWPDYRHRIYNSNIISKIVEKLEQGLREVNTFLESDGPNTEMYLKSVFKELSASCGKYVSIAKANVNNPDFGRTKLDKERLKLCIREIECIASSSADLRALVTKRSCKEHYKTAHSYLQKLKFLMEDPQDSLPDIFLWVISDGKRMAYQRISAQTIIYSTIDEERGCECAKVQTLFLKLPGKKSYGPSGWTIQAKLQIYMWLGLVKHKKNFYTGLPRGYEVSQEIKNSEPPSLIHYTQKHTFQLRAHIYQARSLAGSDLSGLSDPFARVIIGEFTKTTQVINETLSPIWDELLIFDEVLIYGHKDYIETDPPPIVIEIFDKNKVAKSEFIGRAVVKPHVKLYHVPYIKPKFPPRLEWYEITRGSNRAGELLATFELLELSPNNETKNLPDLPEPKPQKSHGPLILPVHPRIQPVLTKYRMEVVFWGLRDLKRIYGFTVTKPKVEIECADHIISTPVVQNGRKNPNFNTAIKFLELELPMQEHYRPPLTIRALNCGSFGRCTLIGVHTINSIQKYVYNPLTKKEAEAEEQKKNTSIEISRRRTQKEVENAESSKETEMEDDESSKNWWTKYFASVEAMIEENGEEEGKENLKEDQRKSSGFRFPARKRNIALCKIYPNELEDQPEFNHFQDRLQIFKLYHGKDTGDNFDDESRIIGTFKGAIKLYKWPLSKDIDDRTIMGFELQNGFFQGIPSNDPVRVLVRVYIVKAHNLHPMDLNGKADPYVVIQLGAKRISDKEHYISKQLNPVFGKCFELEATFPQDTTLIVQIKDWDLLSADDMIGETRIDLENRFYSRHRATCGLPTKYETEGYNKWRDPMKPTQILTKLCREAKLDLPTYTRNQVKIGKHKFSVDDVKLAPNSKNAQECMALHVLRHWHEIPRIGCHLVPEHIETRPLYNPDKPYIEQGKLEMWVDLFPIDMVLPTPAVDISPPTPKSYELRVIIWNTDEVILADDAFFTGQKMSDIYVKGWLAFEHEHQYTDTHYRSLTGEGNFNWRFVFPFDYIEAEKKIVIFKKESIFSLDETEYKRPARLRLQVWDEDRFSADDFLGALTFDLHRIPRGAKSAKLCTLDMLKTDGTVPTVNIFKKKRMKGWWPFFVRKSNEEIELTGKVEAEIHLVTKEEAERNPVGLGRNEPEPLDKPNRPDTSFLWFFNPFKTFRYIIWYNYKWKIIKFVALILLATVTVKFVLLIPECGVKKLLGV